MRLAHLFCSVTLVCVFANAHAQSADSNVHHVSALTPVQGHGRVLSADRPASLGPSRLTETAQPSANAWKLQATLAGAVIHDIAFASPQIGYAVAELGQVWKTVDGGSTWTEILNLGFPYYWYGIAAQGKKVVISGFEDSIGEGIIRRSSDGGKTWTSDIVLTASGWSGRVHFANKSNGLVVDQLSLNAPNAAHFTTNGGARATDWTSTVPDPGGGWFGDQFSMLSNLRTRISGIEYCDSRDGGQTFGCGPSIDPVFDGPVFFVNQDIGWVGGGEIFPNVEGWVHRSTDGGQTWSGRTLDIPWPIREIYFLTPKIGWAAGGNVYTGVGGIHFSRDGGKTWSLDVNTASEMKSCDSKRSGRNVQIWCAGFDASLNGVVYTLVRKMH
jgi:photosystem II stability/assembly factor-like uncharacterized protein